MKLVAHAGNDPVSWVRCVWPLSELKRAGGHELGITARKGMSESAFAEAREATRNADVIHMPATCPGGSYSNAPDEFVNRRGALVVDIDDDVWSWTRDPAADEWRRRSRGMRKLIDDETVPWIESWIQNADLVTTTTDYLAEILRAHGARDVVVCPNAVPLEALKAPKKLVESAATVFDPRAPRKSAVLEKIRGTRVPKIDVKLVGWTGSIAHIADLPPVLKVLRQICAVNPSVGVRSLGPVNFLECEEWARQPAWKVNYGPVLRGPPENPDSWSVPFQDYYDALALTEARVAVIPMRDSPFNLGKSSITLYSWAIQGVPAVVSRTGPYAAAEKEGFPAVYVDHEDLSAWKRALEDLLYVAGAVEGLGERAKAWVLERHSFPGAVQPWARAFEKAIENRRGRTSSALA